MKVCPECGYEDLPWDLRSTPQNRWYWGFIVGPIRDFCQRRDNTTYSKDQLHEGIKGKYLGFTANPLGGTPIPISTATLSKKQFSYLCDRLIADYAQEGLDFSEAEHERSAA